MESTNPQRWARVPPGLAWKRPGLPKEWVRVLERHPEGVTTLPDWVLAGYAGEGAGGGRTFPGVQGWAASVTAAEVAPAQVAS
jgi:hypothetical protein